MSKLAKRQDTVKFVGVERTPSADVLSALSIQLISLGNRLNAVGDALSAPVGQSSARWQVLAAAEGRPLSVAEVARRLGLARQSVQRVADLLAAEGLAEYRENPAHRRAKFLALTGEGQAVLRAIQVRQAEWANRVSAALDEAALTQAAAVLETVAQALADGD